MAWHHRSNILYGPSHTSNPKTKNDKAYPKKVTLVLAPHYTLFAQSSTSHFSSKDDHSPQQHDVEANCRRLVAFQSKQGNHIDCCIDWGETIQRSIWNFFCCFTGEIEDDLELLLTSILLISIDWKSKSRHDRRNESCHDRCNRSRQGQALSTEQVMYHRQASVRRNKNRHVRRSICKTIVTH
jgi:hypothetical protein